MPGQGLGLISTVHSQKWSFHLYINPISEYLLRPLFRVRCYVIQRWLWHSVCPPKLFVIVGERCACNCTRNKDLLSTRPACEQAVPASFVTWSYNFIDLLLTKPTAKVWSILCYDKIGDLWRNPFLFILRGQKFEERCTGKFGYPGRLQALEENSASSGGGVERQAVQLPEASCVSFPLLWHNPRENNLKEEPVYFGSQFQSHHYSILLCLGSVETEYQGGEHMNKPAHHQ